MLSISVAFGSFSSTCRPARDLQLTHIGSGDPSSPGHLLRPSGSELRTRIYLPEPAAIEAHGRAVARGVDVRVMAPSAGASDMPIVQHDPHRNFEQLLALGVRILEYQKRCSTRR